MKGVYVLDNGWVNHLVAEAATDEPEFKAAAEAILAEVKVEAAKHHKTGIFESHIEMDKGSVDYFIHAHADSGYDWSLEFGHFAGSKKLGEKRKWVKGAGIFRKVVARHGGF